MTQWNRRIVKFVNHCDDRVFDVTALGKVFKGSSQVVCLELKSIGPISVNSNVIDVVLVVLLYTPKIFEFKSNYFVVL